MANTLQMKAVLKTDLLCQPQKHPIMWDCSGADWVLVAGDRYAGVRDILPLQIRVKILWVII